MKKVLLIFALAFAVAMHAQQSYFTVYNFSVKPEDGATVFKLVDDYYSKNKPAGVTVSLYENHLHNSANNYTHSLVFNGPLDALGNAYASGPSDSWSLFLTQLMQHSTGSSSASGMVVSGYGDMNEYFFWLMGDYFCEHLLGSSDRNTDIRKLVPHG